MRRFWQIFLGLIALATGGGALWLYWRLGNDAWPPVLLGLLIALTCILRLISLRS